ncbi:midnolin homolog [Condylostylus longicornis]|uniref:midnolin homolog n=1 Tax=Condylostylus longicornis TaxID=2530218 RepID=UPI00244DC209|nr:midnolin homolog [Condylostylus longicornis]
MKFTIALALLGFAFAIQASPIDWSVHHHPEVSVWGNGWGHHNDWHGDAWQHGGWDDGHWSHGHAHTHGISLAQGGGWDHHHHGPVHAHHDHHHHHHHGHYVAKTLGAVHTAPLPGHIASVKSINVAAPPAGH